MFASILAIVVIALTPLHGLVHHNKIKHLSPMEQVALAHHWNVTEVQDAWTILYDESTSTPNQINIYAYNKNSGCAGAAQFASWQQYYTYGGNPKTILGQLIAFGNYITSRYGWPSIALAFHQAHGYY